MPDPESRGSDAFLILNWSMLKPYIFPPFALIGRILQKTQVDQAILIVPFWHTQHWFPLLIEDLCSYPIRIPRHRDLLTLTHSGEKHPLIHLSLIACVVSG